MNPSELIIDDVYPTMISANSFLDSVRYALKIKPPHQQEGAKGGIENQGKKIVKGVAAEDINACLPIFICEEHWRNAKLLMKPVLGWVLTTDPLGYAYTQKMNVPFLLLSKYAINHIKDPKSEFFQQMFNRMMETCIQIMRDDEEPSFGGTWRQEFVNSFRGYFTEAEVRCENIAKNEIFMMQAFCARKIGWLNEKDFEDFEKMFEKICEEQLRRNQKKWDEDSISENVLKILGISDKVLDNVLEKLKKGSEEKKEEESKSDAVYMDKLIKIDEILQKEYENSETLKGIYKEYLDLFKTVCEPLFVLKKLINEKPVIEIHNFKELNIHKDIQFLCLYLQNKTQHKISERKKALKFKNYRDFAFEDQCIDFIETIASISILDYANTKGKFRMKGVQKQKMESKLNVSQQSKYSALQTLIYTENMDEAVEIFKRLNKSSRIFYFYYFKRYPGNKFAEKLKILMTGKYQGEVVRSEWTDSKFYPKNSIVRRIISKSGNDPEIYHLFGMK